MERNESTLYGQIIELKRQLAALESEMASCKHITGERTKSYTGVITYPGDGCSRSASSMFVMVEERVCTKCGMRTQRVKRSPDSDWSDWDAPHAKIREV